MAPSSRPLSTLTRHLAGPLVSGAALVLPLAAAPAPVAATHARPDRIVAADRANTWSVTGSATVARTGATATLLKSGLVLVAGGGSASAELYNPATGTWQPTGSMSVSRSGQTATLLQSGDVLVTGGCGAPCTSAELYHPSTGTWTVTGSMLVKRVSQTATLLPDGDVLIAGGNSCGGTLCTLSEAELYHPSTGVFSRTGSMRLPRESHAAVLLPNGKVLVSGGCADINFDFPCSDYTTKAAELYNPATGTWTRTGSMNVARLSHTLTVLPGTGQVLAVGGFNGNILASAERYDPATGRWAPTTGMAYGRLGHTATALRDGTVLVAGGCYDQPCTAAEVYNPVTDAWSATGPMTTARLGHTATALPDGDVLATGGCGCTAAELYTPGATPFVRLSTSSLNFGDQLAGTHGAAQPLTVSNTGTRPLLITGVLFSGADPADFSAESICAHPIEPGGSCTFALRFSPTATSGRTAVASIYDNAPTSPQQVSLQGWGTGPDAWARTANLIAAVADPTATLLPDGSVLVAGGYTNGFDTVASAEVFDPKTLTWRATGNMSFARAQQTATLLPDGKVLIAGGCGFGSCGNGYATAGAELYDPVTGTFTPTGNMTTARGIHTATLLPDGKVLVTGGVTGCCPRPALRTAEIYDPATGTWTQTGSMTAGRERQTATLLRDGRVLIAGGCSTNLCGGYLASAEIYDPRTGRFTPTGSMTTPRAGHTATLLPNGDVLVAGGQACGFPCPGLASAEVYDPATGTWTAVGSMATPRTDATATLLTSGQVLVAGGCSTLCDASGTAVAATAELFDPATGTWHPTGPLHDLRVGHVATLLADGTVLVAGGFDQNLNPVASAERYTPPLLAARPARGRSGDKVTVTGADFFAHETVKIYWDAISANPLTVASTNSAGTFSAAITVPSAPAGSHTLLAIGTISRASARAGFHVVT